MTKPERSVYTPTDFIQWRDSNTLALTPKFQRRAVWKAPARAFFIDTILREMPIPPIYLRVVQRPHARQIIREVVDGQQRVTAVLDFIDGKFRLARSLDAPWRGKSFESLTSAEQKTILGYSFSAEVFQGISDGEVLSVFARLNTYSVPLNRQELRNGKYFGYFKQTAYGLAYEHLEFWRKHRIVTEQNIARMLEVELTSELIIAQLGGMQDKKTSIDEYYEKYDLEFAQKRETEDRFRRTVDVITNSLGDQLKNTEFRRPPLFYTLFCVVFHHLFGLPKQTLRTPKKLIARDLQLELRDAVLELSDKILTAKADEPVSETYQKFVAACLSQTDNISPRQIRFEKLYKQAF